MFLQIVSDELKIVPRVNYYECKYYGGFYCKNVTILNTVIWNFKFELLSHF